MAKGKVTVSLDKSLLKIIDDERGKIKRSTHINDILEQHYGVGEYASKKASKKTKAKKEGKEIKKRK